MRLIITVACAVLVGACAEDEARSAWRLYAACSSSSQCHDGQSCTDGACTAVCTQTPTGEFACPAKDIPESAQGVVCSLELASDRGYCRPRCKSDSDCPTDLHCDDSLCIPESMGDGTVSK